MSTSTGGMKVFPYSIQIPPRMDAGDEGSIFCDPARVRQAAGIMVVDLLVRGPKAKYVKFRSYFGCTAIFLLIMLDH